MAIIYLENLEKKWPGTSFLLSYLVLVWRDWVRNKVRLFWNWVWLWVRASQRVGVTESETEIGLSQRLSDESGCQDRAVRNRIRKSQQASSSRLVTSRSHSFGKDYKSYHQDNDKHVIIDDDDKQALCRRVDVSRRRRSGLPNDQYPTWKHSLAAPSHERDAASVAPSWGVSSSASPRQTSWRWQWNSARQTGDSSQDDYFIPSQPTK